MYLGWVTAQKANFLSLQSAVFCAECELISENTTPYCLACGSKAMLSLSRDHGWIAEGTGNRSSDRRESNSTAWCGRPAALGPEPSQSQERMPAASVPMHAGRHHLRTVAVSDGFRSQEELADLGHPSRRFES